MPRRKKQLDTPMAHAILEPADSKMLDEFPPKPFKKGECTYEVKKQGDKIIYTVSDGKSTSVFPVNLTRKQQNRHSYFKSKFETAGEKLWCLSTLFFCADDSEKRKSID